MECLTKKYLSFCSKAWSQCEVSMINVIDCLGYHLAKHHSNKEHFGFRGIAFTAWRQILNIATFS